MNGVLWLLHLFFPRECVHCGVLLDYRNRTYLCSACRALLIPLERPVCEKCGQPLNQPDDLKLNCPACRKDPPAYRRARSAISFSGAGRSLVLAYKYSANPYLAGAALRLLLNFGFRWYDRGGYDLAIPVPLHPRKVRERGFDQSAVLARGLSRATGIPLACKCLIRACYTPSQTRLDREARQKNIQGAFRVRSGGLPVEAAILLIDDVYTTGATVNECATVLRAAGAAAVDVLTLARAVER